MGPDSHKLILGYILVGLTQSSGAATRKSFMRLSKTEKIVPFYNSDIDVCTILQQLTFAVLSAPILMGVSLLVKNSRGVEKIIHSLKLCYVLTAMHF